MKNKNSLLLWIILFAFALLSISFFGGPVPYVFFFVVLLLPLACLVYIACVIAGLKIYQKTDGRDTVAKDPAEFYITLQNEGFIPFSSLRLCFYSSFSTITDLEDSVVYELPPHSSLKRRTKLVCRYRGSYEVGLKQIVVKDFLGLFSVNYRIREPLNIIVAPAVNRMTEPEGEEQWQSSHRVKMKDRTEPDIPVREYQPGDEIRSIHWKSSAVMQKLMVRERIGEERNGVAIILDSRRFSDRPEDYLPPENRVCECVLSTALYYMEKNIPVDVYTDNGGTEHYPVQRTEDFDAFYEKLRRFMFRKENTLLPRLAELFSEGRLQGCQLIVLAVQQWTDEDQQVLESLNPERIPVKVVLCEEEGKA